MTEMANGARGQLVQMVNALLPYTVRCWVVGNVLISIPYFRW